MGRCTHSMHARLHVEEPEDRRQPCMRPDSTHAHTKRGVCVRVWLCVLPPLLLCGMLTDRLRES